MADAVLQDRRVLVVEDEYLIAEAMSRNLRRAGATVLGPVSNVASALALIEGDDGIDAAVLDIKLGEQKVYPVVDVLLARGAHCVFATGNDPADVPAAYALLTRCEKPVDPGCIIEALAERRSAPSVAGTDPTVATLKRLREQMLEQIQVADGAGQSLIAVKLSEALDVVEMVIAGRAG